MTHRRLALLVAAALLAVAVWVPAASALSSSLRVEASSKTVAPRTAINLPNGPFRAYDSAGNVYSGKQPSILSLLAQTAARRGFSWEASTGQYGSFLTTVDGFAALGDWSNWWTVVVNGLSSDIGVDAALKQGDSVLLAQVPTANYLLSGAGLVAELSTKLGATDDPLTITVKADDFSKANSQAEYDRYGFTDPAKLQTPEQFPVVEGATVHVGSETYTTDADGKVVIEKMSACTRTIWAERATTETTWYARSESTLVNFAAPLSLTDAAVSPASFSVKKAKATFSWKLSRAATVTIEIRNASNRVVVSKKIRAGANAGGFTWNGRAGNGRLVPVGRYTAKVSAADTWGRSAGAPVSFKLTATR